MVSNWRVHCGSYERRNTMSMADKMRVGLWWFVAALICIIAGLFFWAICAESSLDTYLFGALSFVTLVLLPFAFVWRGGG